MKTFRKIIFLGVVFLTYGICYQGWAEEPAPPPTTPAETAVPEQAPVNLASAYQGIYKSGNAPFAEKTRLKITKVDDAFLFVPLKGEAWNLPLKSMRGAVVSPKGVWIYWFDDSGNTLNGFVDMTEGNTLLAGDINQAVSDYFINRPQADEDKLKANYESYKEQALREAK